MKPYFLSIIIAVFFFACNDNKRTDTTSVRENALGKKTLPGDIIYLTARPDSISVDVASTAIIVVDMQNDFGAKGGMFDKAGIDISVIQQVINPISNVLNSARKRGIKIIYLKMGFKQDLSDVGGLEYPTRVKRLKRMHIGDTVIAPDGSISRILVHNTWNTDIIPQLKPQPDDIIIYKNRFNGFYHTTLDSILRSLEKKYLIIVGCTTSICVESTVRDASFRDYLPIVLEDCTAEPIGNGLPRSNHEASLLVIKTSFGLVSTSKEFIKSIEKRFGAYGQSPG
jgi:ureidoacrylate peracid hydrolase